MPETRELSEQICNGRAFDKLDTLKAKHFRHGASPFRAVAGMSASAVQPMTSAPLQPLAGVGMAEGYAGGSKKMPNDRKPVRGNRTVKAK